MARTTSPSLDLRELPLKSGERTERVVAIEPYPIFLGGQRYQVVPQGEGADVVIERLSGGYLVTVVMEASVFGACYRCLRELEQQVEARQQEFVPSNPEKWDEDDISPFIDDCVVDLVGLTREAVILALPEKLLCREDCLGICPHCGKDRNLEECHCLVEQLDPRWEKLRELGLGEGEELGLSEADGEDVPGGKE
ncbi:MAG TPA: DUF177 domain-containing protein [Thermoleophilia bacterium]|nr:DUF177 domain-containing protein [Thermoleophilia bacterium]